MGRAWHLHLQFLLLFHLGMVAVFSYYVGKEGGGDSQAYWNLQGPLANPDAQSWADYFGIGYPFLYWLNYVPSKVFGWSWWTGNVLYALIGYGGFRYLSLWIYRQFHKHPQFHGLPLILIVLYFPNLHFWTAGVGKEALCFWALGAVLYGFSRFREHGYKLLVVLGFGLMFMVRTYLVAVLAVSVLISLLLDTKHQSNRGRWGIAVLGLILLLSMPLLFWYSGIRNMESVDLIALSKQQLQMLSGEGIGSSVPMLDYGQAMRWLTYWFRPFIWEARGPFFVFASGVENTVNLILIFYLLLASSWGKWKDAPFYVKWLPVLFLVSSLFYANILGNLGIMMRLKSPFMLLFILFLGWMQGKKHNSSPLVISYY